MSDVASAFAKYRADKAAAAAKGEPAPPKGGEPAKGGEPPPPKVGAAPDAKGGEPPPAKGGEPAKGAPPPPKVGDAAAAAKGGEPAKGEPPPPKVEGEGETRVERRLRVLLGERKTMAAQLAALQAEVTALKAAPPVPPPAAPSGEPPAPPRAGPAAPPADPRMAAMEKQVYELEVARETARLEAEIAAVRKDHPGVPASLLAQAVARDETVDLAALAAEFDAFLDDVRAVPKGAPDVEAKAAADKTAADKAAAAAAAAKALARPAASSGGGGATDKANPYAGAKTVADIFRIRREQGSGKAA